MARNKNFAGILGTASVQFLAHLHESTGTFFVRYPIGQDRMTQEKECRGKNGIGKTLFQAVESLRSFRGLYCEDLNNVSELSANDVCSIYNQKSYSITR